jgi:hypothetical protein
MNFLDQAHYTLLFKLLQYIQSVIVMTSELMEYLTIRYEFDIWTHRFQS